MYFSRILPLLLSIPVAFAAPTSVEDRAAVANNPPKPSACPTGISAARSAEVKKAFTSSGVVPTLIPSINPKVEVSVKYGNKAVNLGNQFLTTETVTQPNLTFTAEPGYDPNKVTYSYFLVDPDVPNPDSPVRVNFLHWLVSNARSVCAKSQSPNTIATYQTLTPASTQQHRYTFLVYREPPNYKPDIITPQTRAGFDLNGYVKRAGLVLVGGNFLREAITNGVPVAGS